MPANPKPVGKYVNDKPFEASWECASVVGMMLYLSGNSRPDITFAVDQAARFTHAPKKSHGVTVKRIVRCLRGTKDRGLIFKPQTDWKVDCFVDADFCGLWGSEDPNDPVVTWNLHSRGSVENVSLVSSVGPSVLFALIVALDAPLLPATVCEKHQY